MQQNTKQKFLNIVGLMSGTSMDGIDACIVNTNGIKLERYNLTHSTHYRTPTKLLLNEAIKDPLNFIKNKKLYRVLSEKVTIDHAKCIEILIKKAKVNIDLVGFHGQTIYHDPQNKISIQIGDPVLLSQVLKIDVISDFRLLDINNGGQGAPLAPIYHKKLIEDLKLDLPSCFLNIGGISNITYLNENQLIGFDSGPGNALIDQFMQKNLNKNFDCNGALASKGKVINKYISKFLSNPFFFKPFPKSLDKNYFEEIFKEVESSLDSLENKVCTLTEMTIASIELEVNKLPLKPKNVVLSGGGSNNQHIVEALKKRLKMNVILANEFGLNSQIIEAELFAYLAARSLFGLPITFPYTTGVSKMLTGGRYYKKPLETLL
jgi:anhydro-N-acetylmuramic acid kinase